jgi:hypothetical protein
MTSTRGMPLAGWRMVPAAAVAVLALVGGLSAGGGDPQVSTEGRPQAPPPTDTATLTIEVMVEETGAPVKDARVSSFSCISSPVSAPFGERWG